MRLRILGRMRQLIGLLGRKLVMAGLGGELFLFGEGRWIVRFIELRWWKG